MPYHISAERKQAILSKLLPPHNLSVAELARQEGIHTSTFYVWRNKARSNGVSMLGNAHQPEQWSAEAKLATVIATAVLSEAELSHYCREQGLYPEQVRSWRNAALEGFARSSELSKAASKDARQRSEKISTSR